MSSRFSSGGHGAERLPTEAIFTEIYQSVWFDNTTDTEDRWFPPGCKWVTDDFSDPDLGRFTQQTEGTAGTLAIAAGVATVTLPLVGTHSLFVSEGAAIGMPQVTVAATVTGKTGIGGAYLAAVVGVIKDPNNYLCVNWDLQNNNILLQRKVAGVSTFTAGVSTAGWGAFPIRVALTIVGNFAYIWAYYSSTWHLVQSTDLTATIDFKAEDHSLWYGFFGGVAPGTVANTISFDDFHIGRFGGVGVRDLCIVTNPDGSAYDALGTYQRYVLATLAGPYGGIPSGSMGCFVFDTRTKELIQTSVIMCQRGGKVQNDHAGHAVRNADGSTHLLISTWGDNPTNPPMIRHELVAAGTDPLTTDYVMASSAELALTELPAGGAQYDPFLVLIEGTYYLAYTASESTANDFYPVIDTSTDLATWTNHGMDSDARPYEGSRITKFAGTYYALWGGQSNMRMYTLAPWAYYGLVNALSPGYVDPNQTQPHAMIWPEQSTYWLLTFDPYTYPPTTGPAFSWGRVRLFASPRY